MNTPLLQTVIAVNYLPFALALAQSVRAQLPGARLCVLVSDASAPVLQRIRVDFGDLAEFIGVDDVGFAPLAAMRTYYNVLEFSSACKILALDYQLRVRGEPDCFFIDPDMYVLGDFTAAARALQRDIVVTPHATMPYPDDGQLPNDAELAASGSINGGFIYVRRGAAPALQWLLRQVPYRWFVAPGFGMYADQHWLSLLPYFFADATGLLRDAGVNIAYWNLHERPLVRKGDAFVIGVDAAQQALLFHFSGFAMPSRGRLTKHSARRFDAGTEAVLAELIVRYERTLDDMQARCARSAIVGDLSFSDKPLVKRMRIASALAQRDFIEIAPARGLFERLGRALDRLTG